MGKEFICYLSYVQISVQFISTSIYNITFPAYIKHLWLLNGLIIQQADLIHVIFKAFYSSYSHLETELIPTFSFPLSHSYLPISKLFVGVGWSV